MIGKHLKNDLGCHTRYRSDSMQDMPVGGAGSWDAMLVATTSTTMQMVLFYNHWGGGTQIEGDFSLVFLFFLCDRLRHTMPTF